MLETIFQTARDLGIFAIAALIIKALIVKSHSKELEKFKSNLTFQLFVDY